MMCYGLQMSWCVVLVGVLLAGQSPGAPAEDASTAPMPASPANGDGEPAPPAATTTLPVASVPDTKVPTRHSRLIGSAVVDLVMVAPPTVDRESAANAAFDEILRVERLFSSAGPAIATLVEDAGGPARTIEPDVFAVLVEVARVAKLSKGAFDPSAAAYDALWSEAATTDGERRILPSPTLLKARRAVVGPDQLQLDAVQRTARLKTKGARLDVAAVARGYALDRARGALIERGASGFVLSSAGDVVFHGEKDSGPWIIGLQDPRATGPFLTLAGSIALGGAVMTAVDTDGAFFVDEVRQHRLLDPRSGEPARKARSVAVIGGDALTAKCLARAIFVLGAKDGLTLAARHKGVEIVIVDSKNVVHLSPGLKKLATTGGLHQRPPTDAP
jgi:thiamine biosynthesis lipoprotein